MSDPASLIVEYIETLENELSRSLAAHRTIITICGDILDEKRRAGPGAFRPLRVVREEFRANADAPLDTTDYDEAYQRLRGMQEEEL